MAPLQVAGAAIVQDGRLLVVSKKAAPAVANHVIPMLRTAGLLRQS